MSTTLIMLAITFVIMIKVLAYITPKEPAPLEDEPEQVDPRLIDAANSVRK